MLIFHGALITGEWGVARSCRKSHLGPAKIAFFFSQEFSQNNKHDTFWHVSIGYFYVIWAIAFQIFVPWNFITTLTFPCLLSLLQSTSTQITISINIIICFKYYTIWKYNFLLRYMLRFFIYHSCRLCKNYWIFYCANMTSYVNWVDEIVDVMIFVKKINKN